VQDAGPDHVGARRRVGELQQRVETQVRPDSARDAHLDTHDADEDQRPLRLAGHQRGDRPVQGHGDDAGEDQREQEPGGAGHAALTRREEQVADLVAEGLSNRQIGLRLHLSERTVENHVAHILDKPGSPSRARIAAWHAGRPRGARSCDHEARTLRRGGVIAGRGPGAAPGAVARPELMIMDRLGASRVSSTMCSTVRRFA
jgi:DNA-binding CsgD family transcriptional regulator